MSPRRFVELMVLAHTLPNMAVPDTAILWNDPVPPVTVPAKRVGAMK